MRSLKKKKASVRETCKGLLQLPLDKQLGGRIICPQWIRFPQPNLRWGMGMEALDCSLYWVLSRLDFTYIFFFLQSSVLEVLGLSYLPLGNASVAQKDEQLVTVVQAAVTGQVFSLQRLMLLPMQLLPSLSPTHLRYVTRLVFPSHTKVTALRKPHPFCLL